VTNSLFDLYNTEEPAIDRARMDAARQAAQKGIESARDQL